MKFDSLSIGNLQKMFTPGTHPHPVRDWFVVLGAVAVLIGLSAGWNAWMFIQNTRDVEVAVPSAPQEFFDTAKVEAVDAAFAERKKEEGRYRAEYHFVDPSL